MSDLNIFRPVPSRNGHAATLQSALDGKLLESELHERSEGLTRSSSRPFPISSPSLTKSPSCPSLAFFCNQVPLPGLQTPSTRQFITRPGFTPLGLAITSIFPKPGTPHHAPIVLGLPRTPSRQPRASQPRLASLQSPPPPSFSGFENEQDEDLFSLPTKRPVSYRPIPWIGAKDRLHQFGVLLNNLRGELDSKSAETKSPVMLVSFSPHVSSDLPPSWYATTSDWLAEGSCGLEERSPVAF